MMLLQLEELRKGDVFSELADIDYLDKLTVKVNQAVRLLADKGLVSPDPSESLSEHRDRARSFSVHLKDAVLSFQKELPVTAPPWTESGLAGSLERLPALWHVFESCLEAAESNYLREEDWTEGGEPCPYLLACEQLHPSEDPSWTSDELSWRFLTEGGSAFRNSFLAELHQVKEQLETAQAKLEKVPEILAEAERAWAKGDLDATQAKLDGLLAFKDFGTELSNEIAAYVKLRKDVEKLRFEVSAHSDRKLIVKYSVLVQSWDISSQKLKRLRSRSETFSYPLVEKLDLAGLEKKVKEGKALAEKRLRELERGRKRRRVVNWCVGLVLLAGIVGFLAYEEWKEAKAAEEEKRMAEEKRLAEEREKRLAQEREKRLAEEKRLEEERKAEARRARLYALMRHNYPLGKPWAVPTSETIMLWCPSGTFQMGSPEGEEDREDDETLHAVTLTLGFWLGRHEVTQAQWEKVMGSNPSRFKGPDRPVEKVSWEDAVAFCEKLTELERKAGRVPEGWAYQLPTEAQWEYACRAGTRARFSFGGELTEKDANFARNVGETTNVGKYPANAWGFHDMHGNVWEWSRDWYDSDYYEQASAKRDPLGPAAGSDRVLRGGSWSDWARYARSAFRNRIEPGHRILDLGFRLSFSVHGKAE